MLQVQLMEASDWPEVAAIYGAGIKTGNATFETRMPSWEEWDAAHLPSPRLVATEERVVGWVAVSPVSDRCVYGGVAEVSLYVAETARGQGVGSTLLKSLVNASGEHGLWTLQTGIFPENVVSMALFEHGGFRVVGRREAIGKMGDRWRDVMLLERRSPSPR